MREGGETVRRRLDGDATAFDFAVLHDFKARGGTEYFAFPVASDFDFGLYMAAYVSIRPGGFTREGNRRSHRGVAAPLRDRRYEQSTADRRKCPEGLFGPQTGPRVLAGRIRRGSGEAIAAVLWSSDLRGFTQLSDHSPAERVIGVLNDLFDLQAKAIAGHGGEILKFVGDGLLAIFPVADPTEAKRAATNALAAARQAQAALVALREREASSDERPLEIVIALHYGTVTYGNVGSADRLDFTVIGPAVNLVSRVEAVAKSLDLPLVVTD